MLVFLKLQEISESSCHPFPASGCGTAIFNMKLGSLQNDLDSSPGHSMNESFRKLAAGMLQNDFEISSEQSLDGSFRKSETALSSHSISDTSVSSKFRPSSRRVSKGLKEYGKKVVDLEIFRHNLRHWVAEKLRPNSSHVEQLFGSPCMIDELNKLDLALEGVLFQQLFRMPCSPYLSDDIKEDEYLAVEDFLHAIVSGLWRTFWHKRGQLPFFLSCLCYPGLKFYTLEKAVSKGRHNELRGFALMSKLESNLHIHWDQVVEFALFNQDILSGNELSLSTSIICEALFYGFHILLSRSLSKTSIVNNNSVFVLVLDCKYGGVVKLEGDIRKLESNPTNPYHSAVDWIQNHAEISVSPVDQIWNKLGNASWGDIGTLQILLASFCSIIQSIGPPRKSIASLASQHSLRLQKRWMECRVMENHNALVPFQHNGQHQREIVEVGQNDQVFRKKGSSLKLKPGDILQLDDQNHGLKTFQVLDAMVGGNNFLYYAVSLDYPAEPLNLYMGSHPSRLEPSWEDMSLWYEVQRQTKVLNILKQQGSLNKHLPEIVASGKILHPGHCKKQNPGGKCDHPWCGTPILVTSPVGEPIASIVARDGPFSPEDAIRCCRDCVVALRTAAISNIQHGDISPENIIRVVNTQGVGNNVMYVPISWGRAVLEDRDSPAINLHFSSSHALQHGKLCPSSDAESLVYLLLFVCGGAVEQQESIESALQWRETSWAKRLIQQQIGEISALLKAFADYVDSLCGTPYSVDYDIWLKRLSEAIDCSIDRGKMIEEMAITVRVEDAAESSGTSGGCN